MTSRRDEQDLLPFAQRSAEGSSFPNALFFFFCQPPPVPGNNGPGQYEKSAVLKSSHEIPIVKKGQSSGICAEYCVN